MGSSSAFFPPGDELHKCSDGFVYTAPVGRFKPNQFGLYDMLGNVDEWTLDCWSKEDYSGAPTDGTARLFTGDCANRVNRGGAFNDEPRDVRVAVRGVAAKSRRFPWLGFRVARELR